MPTIIDVPASGQIAKVRVNGATRTICATGEASRPGNVFPTAVWAKVYQTQPSPVPSSPPGDATQGTVSSGDQWSFTGTQEIPGANSSDQSPYPANWVVVWAQYANSTPQYDPAMASFQGQSSTQTDCG